MTSAADPFLAFDEAIALETVGDGRLRADIAPGWDIRGNPHGGYLLSMVVAAGVGAIEQNDPISVAANYLAPPRFGEADLVTEVIRAGRRQSTVEVRLGQAGTECVRAVITYGTLSDESPTLWGSDVVAPPLPTPDRCADLQAVIREEGEDVRLHERVELRLHPETGWIRGKPSGVPQFDGWLRFVDGREPDPLALLLYSDGFPPSIFEAVGLDVGHVPTVQLTTHLFARPAPGWVQARFRTRVRGGGFVDEDGELWDSTGRLVATTRQLALVRD